MSIRRAKGMRAVLPLFRTHGWDSVVAQPETCKGRVMAGTHLWNTPIACVGLAAYVGMLFRFPLLVHMVQNGELSLLQAAPTVIGALLLLVGCLGLLLRRPPRGWLFAIATVALLIGLLWLPNLVFSFWLWMAVLAALAGALVGFRATRGGTPVA
ncbi:hypothetical protein [Dyella sp. 20L07]|uniref:hypothetical protein n=1 Tax=Dyella sp. 20L07 TaxID=3384240 RepID=UPI003D2B5F00